MENRIVRGAPEGSRDGCASTSLLALTRVLHNKSPRPQPFHEELSSLKCSLLAPRWSPQLGQHLSRLGVGGGLLFLFFPFSEDKIFLLIFCIIIFFRNAFVTFLKKTTTFFWLYELNMTFRRLKKVNSSEPESGTASQDSDIYFPSSKSDSCRTVVLPTNSSEVYNHKTLAYSGGTLPRNFKKVNERVEQSIVSLMWLWVVASYWFS